MVKKEVSLRKLLMLICFWAYFFKQPLTFSFGKRDFKLFEKRGLNQFLFKTKPAYPLLPPAFQKPKRDFTHFDRDDDCSPDKRINYSFILFQKILASCRDP